MEGRLGHLVSWRFLGKRLNMLKDSANLVEFSFEWPRVEFALVEAVGIQGLFSEMKLFIHDLGQKGGLFRNVFMGFEGVWPKLRANTREKEW